MSSQETEGENLASEGAAAGSVATGDAVHKWVGVPVEVTEDKRFYNTFDSRGERFTLGEE